ncbi:NB-ARC domain [Musa troglodytarum]|uniref:NB-ARC domain n=1 Tax=Musa troglodytarum TaxID=320322 RepID=A0A9E7G3Q5_9LILI|nr:NB-ARC domain [Musa troglodytarum]
MLGFVFGNTSIDPEIERYHRETRNRNSTKLLRAVTRRLSINEGTSFVPSDISYRCSRLVYLASEEGKWRQASMRVRVGEGKRPRKITPLYLELIHFHVSEGQQSLVKSNIKH